MKTRKRISAILILTLLTTMVLFASCGKQQESAGEPSDVNDKESGIDYMALVNKTHSLPDGWEDALDITTITNSVGDEVEVESKAYEAYTALKKDVEKDLEGYEKGEVRLELDSARRSVAAQQEIWDEFMEKYGEEYTKSHVAEPGYSEHQTGLALDLYFTIDGKDIYENEDLVKYPEIWDAIHARLAEHGFILRYLDGRDDITGYSYEPWHIRYLDDPKITKEITDKDITLEEYLGELE